MLAHLKIVTIDLVKQKNVIFKFNLLWEYLNLLQELSRVVVSMVK